MRPLLLSSLVRLATVNAYVANDQSTTSTPRTSTSRLSMSWVPMTTLTPPCHTFTTRPRSFTSVVKSRLSRLPTTSITFLYDVSPSPVTLEPKLTRRYPRRATSPLQQTLVEDCCRFPDSKPNAPSPPRTHRTSRSTTTSQRPHSPCCWIDQAWRCRPLHPSQGLPGFDAFLSRGNGSFGIVAFGYANGWTSRGSMARYYSKELWCYPLCESLLNCNSAQS